MRGCTGEVRWLGKIPAANVVNLEWKTGDGKKKKKSKSHFLLKVSGAGGRTNQAERGKKRRKKNCVPVLCECGCTETGKCTGLAVVASTHRPMTKLHFMSYLVSLYQITGRSFLFICLFLRKLP